MAILIFLTSTLLMMAPAALGAQYQNYIYDSQGQPSDLNALISRVHEGDVVLVGERHGFYPHHETQFKIVQSLQNLGYSVDVGIEHVPYPLQPDLDSYVTHQTTEETFLKSLGWRKSNFKNCQDYTENGGFDNPFESLPFDCYITTLRLAAEHGGQPLAINLPRSITAKVSKYGINSLTPEEAALLPPNYEWGRDSYYQRFREIMMDPGNTHGAITEEMITNMFWSQSLWDETMSWTSMEHLKKDSKKVFVVLVGDFHAAHGDGLAARFYARGAQKVHIVSQDFAENATLEEINQMGQPDPTQGPAGDLLLITNIVNENPKPRASNINKNLLIKILQ